MRHATRPFTVEVRRGQKKSAFIKPEAIIDNSGDAMLRRAEAALFGTQKSQHEPKRGEPSEPPRKILPSLAEVDPLTDQLAEPLAEAPRRGRKPGSKNKPKLLHELPSTGDTVRHISLTPEVVNAALLAAARNSSVEMPPNRPSTEEPKGNSTVVVVPAVSLRPIAQDLELSPVFSRSETLARAKSILNVYVFGTEPKPWELWKHHLRKLAN